MTLDQLLEHSLTKPDVEESFPFGPEVLVLKVKGKVFLLIPLNTDPLQFNVKCNPERALQLRDEYISIIPGYHMNKKHWNTIILDGTVPSSLIYELIDHSYALVSAKK
ncbi:MAG: MmcQ/YjbR family DNA-binding protein [Bacteroidota bacterium]|jgi:predicted DNA-binding protein (MmcQ/YjbR family)